MIVTRERFEITRPTWICMHPKRGRVCQSFLARGSSQTADRPEDSRILTWLTGSISVNPPTEWRLSSQNSAGATLKGPCGYIAFGFCMTRSDGLTRIFARCKLDSLQQPLFPAPHFLLTLGLGSSAANHAGSPAPGTTRNNFVPQLDWMCIMTPAKFDSQAADNRYRQPASPLLTSKRLFSAQFNNRKGNTNGRTRNSKVV